MSNENDIEDDIIGALQGELPEPVVEQAIPDSHTVQRDEHGSIQPYVAIQFGDLQQGHTYSFAGPRADDYILPIYVQAVSDDARVARRLSNRVRNVMLGLSFPWTGQIRKRAGGPMFPIVSSNSATEAYVFPASFGVVIQFDNY